MEGVDSDSTVCLKQRGLNWVEQKVGDREGSTQQSRLLNPAGRFTGGSCKNVAWFEQNSSLRCMQERP